MSVEHQEPMTQQLKTLLEEGHFEKALLLARACYQDEELGKDQVFLETALILFTNMEKLELMWSEIQKLKSMEQILPVAESLGQYYIPAALLTAEMLLSKEWCTETVSLSDLQKVTDVWVELLWSECGHDKDVFEAKVQQVSKFVLYEPVFILKLVRAIHREVGMESLVFCVNLCLWAFQEPASNPQSNLVNAGRIDLNNAALCQQLSVLFEGDLRLQRLCLLTTFTITPTKKLFAEVDKLYQRSTFTVPPAPLLPSCLSCVLFQTMNSFLPDSICPLLDWKVFRPKCLKYLRSTSQLSLQVRLPEREIAVKMYVKKMRDEMEGSVEETDCKKPVEEEDRANTLSRRQWVSTMMSLDMSWQPYMPPVFPQGNDRKSSSESCLTNSRECDLITASLTKLPRCSVVLQDCEELLLTQNMSNPLTRKQGFDPIPDITVTSSPSVTHNNLSRKQSQAKETKSDIDSDSLLTLRSLASLKPAETSPDVSSEAEAFQDVPGWEVEPMELCDSQQQNIRQDIEDGRQDNEDGGQDIDDRRQDIYDETTMHTQGSSTEDDSGQQSNIVASLANDHVYSRPVSGQKHFVSVDELNLDQDMRNSEQEQNLVLEILSGSEKDDSVSHVQQFNSNNFAEDQAADQQQSIINLGGTCDEDPVFFSEGSESDEFYTQGGYNELFESSLDATQGSPNIDAENYTAESFLKDSADGESNSPTPLMQNIYNGMGTSAEISSDLDNWFQNFGELPQASLMEEDALPEPSMEAERLSTQWAAIKEIDGIVDPSSNVLNWNEMDSWLGDSIVHCNKPVAFPQASQPDSVGLSRDAKLNQKTRTKKCKSLESTISRLRATFVEKDMNLVGMNVNGRDSTSPLSEANSSTTQSSCQEMAEQQPIHQPLFNPQESDQFMTGREQSMSLESGKQQSPQQQMVNSEGAVSPTELMYSTEEQLAFFESTNHVSSCEQPNTSESAVNSAMENDSSDQKLTSLESSKQPFTHQHSVNLSSGTCQSPNVDQPSSEPQLTNSHSANQQCNYPQPIHEKSSINSNIHAYSVEQEELISLELASQQTVSTDPAIQNSTDQQQLTNQFPQFQLFVSSKSNNQESANKLPTFEPENEKLNNSVNQSRFEILSPDEIKDGALQITCSEESGTSFCLNESSRHKVGVGVDNSFDIEDLLPDSPASCTSQEGSVMMISADFDSPTKTEDQGITQTMKQEPDVLKESKEMLLKSLMAVCASEYNRTIKSMQTVNKEIAVSPTSVQKLEPEAVFLNQWAQTPEAFPGSGISKRFVYEDGKLTVIGQGKSFGVVNSGRAKTAFKQEPNEKASNASVHGKQDFKKYSWNIKATKLKGKEDKKVRSSVASVCPIKDKSKDSDSDCSDFEVVQDVSCRWSLSGRQRPAESCASVPNAELLSQVKNGTKAVEVPSLFTGRSVNECKMRPKKSSKLVERNLELEQTDEHTTGRYNLRTSQNPVSYCLSSSNSEAEHCGETLGETRRYHLRNAPQCSTRPPTTTSSKKPRLALKTPRKTTRSKSQKQDAKKSPAEIILAPNITCKWTEEYNSFVHKRSKDASQDSNHKTATTPFRNVMPDRNNNNHHNGKSCNKSTPIRSAPSRVIPSNGTRKTSPPSFHGSFTGISDPKLPWETKPPLRTYAAKKHVSPPM